MINKALMIIFSISVTFGNEELVIEDNDIIQKVDGKHINNPTEALNSLSKNTQDSVDIVRNGKNLHYTKSKKNILLIETNLTYSDGKVHLKNNSKTTIDSQNLSWIPLSQMSDFILLGKLISFNKNEIAMKYIVINTKTDKESLVSNPEIKTPLGKQATIFVTNKTASTGSRERIGVSLNATVVK